MAPEPRPVFPTYLLPYFTIPLSFRRRHSSTTSTTSTTNSETPPSLSFSPRSSISTSPSTSPPTYTIPPSSFPPTQTQKASGLIHTALQNPPQELGTKEKLYRAQPNTLKCITCSSDIAFAEQIVSKGFTGRHGRAYLVAPPPYTSSTIHGEKNTRPIGLVNTKIGRSVNRELLTGAHVVADISCVICGTVLGWKYVDARELAQRYKIGKFIVEMKRVVQVVGWEDGFEEEGEEEGEEDEHNGNPKDKGEGKESEDDDITVFDEEDEDECDDMFAGIWDPDVVAQRRARRVGRR